MLIVCTECGKEVSDLAAACPNCGAPVSSAPAPTPAQHGLNRRVGPGTAVLVFGMLALAFLWAVTAIDAEPSEVRTQRAQDREAVRRCESRYQTANAERRVGRGELDFLDQVCSQLRTDFRAKWGRDP